MGKCLPIWTFRVISRYEFSRYGSMSLVPPFEIGYCIKCGKSKNEHD